MEGAVARTCCPKLAAAAATPRCCLISVAALRAQVEEQIDAHKSDGEKAAAVDASDKKAQLEVRELHGDVENGRFERLSTVLKMQHMDEDVLAERDNRETTFDRLGIEGFDQLQGKDPYQTTVSKPSGTTLQLLMGMRS